MAELIENKNFIFFPKTYLAEGKVTGAAASWGLMVCTKNYIFILPEKSYNEFLEANKNAPYTYFKNNEDAIHGVNRIIYKENQTLEGLESTLLELLSFNKKRFVFKIDELDKIKIYGGVLGQVRLKKRGMSTRVFAPKGRKNKKKLKAFYKD